jgi:hypothetical protein
MVELKWAEVSRANHKPSKLTVHKYFVELYIHSSGSSENHSGTIKQQENWLTLWWEYGESSVHFVLEIER